MHGIVVSEQQLISIMSRFNLSSRKNWLRDVARGLYYRGLYLVVEGDGIFDYVARSGMGIHTEVKKPAS